METEADMSNYEVVLKKVDSQLVASVRSIIPNYQAVGALYEEVFGHLAQHGVRGGLCGAVWHDPGYKERDVDAEAIVFLQQRVPEGGRVQVHELPAARVASVVHRGGYQGLTQAYEAVMGWLETNGYRVVGPNRELYLETPEPMKPENEANVTEIQFPVEKR